jgi:hypothetical protein
MGMWRIYSNPDPHGGMQVRKMKIRKNQHTGKCPKYGN